MTLEEIKASEKLFLTAKDVAPILGSDPNKIRETAKRNPALLGLNVSVVGTRVKIWRRPFLEYISER